MPDISTTRLSSPRAIDGNGGHATHRAVHSSPFGIHHAEGSSTRAEQLKDEDCLHLIRHSKVGMQTRLKKAKSERRSKSLLACEYMYPVEVSDSLMTMTVRAGPAVGKLRKASRQERDCDTWTGCRFERTKRKWCLSKVHGVRDVVQGDRSTWQ